MRIVSFNIKRGFESSIAQIVEAIRKLDPDICLVQEIDRRARRSRFADQHRYLMKHGGFDAGYFIKTKSRNGIGSYGHGLYLKAVSHTKPEIITLPREGTAEKRIACLTTIRPTNRHSFTLASTHLAADHAQAERQLVYLIKELKARSAENERFVLAGDLNLRPAVITQHGFAFEDTQLSCGLPQRIARYDYILSQGIDIDTHVVHLPGLSDHDPIVADL